MFFFYDNLHQNSLKIIIMHIKDAEEFSSCLLKNIVLDGRIVCIDTFQQHLHLFIIDPSNYVNIPSHITWEQIRRWEVISDVRVDAATWHRAIWRSKAMRYIPVYSFTHGIASPIQLSLHARTFV